MQKRVVITDAMVVRAVLQTGTFAAARAYLAMFRRDTKQGY
jgi:hypothetical protein